MGLSDNDKNELRRMRRKLDNIRGPGVKHSPDGIYIGGNGDNGGDGRGGFTKIIAAQLTSQDGTDKTKFAWSQARVITTGIGWEVVSGGLTGTTANNPAYYIDGNSTTDFSGQYCLLALLTLKDASNNPQLTWVIMQFLPGGNAVVKITGAASGGGKYTGASCSGTSSASASGNLSMPEGLTVAGSNDSLVLNTVENGTSAHIIPTGTFVNAAYVGMSGSNKVYVCAIEYIGIGTAVRQVYQMTGSTTPGWGYVVSH